MSSLKIIKIGGSVLTGKHDFPSYDFKNTLRIAQELSKNHKECVLVHGTGSYGKPPAVNFGYNQKGIIDKDDKMLALDIKHSLRQLNQLVVQTLLDARVPAITFNIDHFVNKETLQIEIFNLEKSLSALVNQDILPVLYGDLISNTDGSYQVYSSDQIVLELAKIFKPKSVFFLSDVAGVFLKRTGIHDRDGPYLAKTLSEKNIQRLYRMEKDLIDVSGGMSKKVEIALKASKYCNSCFIGNGYSRNLLSDLLDEKIVRGTYVK
jgi:isopentenyl phosphate kinase